MPNQRDPSPKLRDFARAMRREPSAPEQQLWSHLRGRRLGGFRFRHQVPVLGRIADFACIERMLIVETDGSQHFADGVEERDYQRDDDLARAGWKTLRFTSIQVLRERDAVLRTILAELKERPVMQQPHSRELAPSPACEGGIRKNYCGSVPFCLSTSPAK